MNACWFEEYLGRPWARVPEPPQSYTCGELCRAVLRERLGIETPLIHADAGILRECIENIGQPEAYGLVPVEEPREFDLAFLIRGRMRDHVGIAVDTAEGLMILHCQQGSGVILQSPAEMLGTGWRRIEWFRHELADKASATMEEGTCHTSF